MGAGVHEDDVYNGQDTIHVENVYISATALETGVYTYFVNFFGNPAVSEWELAVYEDGILLLTRTGMGMSSNYEITKAITNSPSESIEPSATMVPSAPPRMATDGPGESNKEESRPRFIEKREAAPLRSQFNKPPASPTPQDEEDNPSSSGGRNADRTDQWSELFTTIRSPGEEEKGKVDDTIEESTSFSTFLSDLLEKRRKRHDADNDGSEVP